MSTIEYWLKSSQDDLDTAFKLMEGKKYHHALFFLLGKNLLQNLKKNYE